MGRTRNWAPSVLLVDTVDNFPANITAATDDIPHINLMPVYGLNVNSMIKHETLVITKTAVEDLTVKLLHALHTTDVKEKKDRNRTGPTELELKWRNMTCPMNDTHPCLLQNTIDV